MNRPLRWKGIPSAFVFATGSALLVGPGAAQARADTGSDIETFCRDALDQASAATRSVEDMVTALADATDRVEKSAPADHETTLQSAQAQIHDLRAAAARQLRASSDNIEEDEPAGLPEDWQGRADRLVGAQRDLADTILHKGAPDLEPSVNDLNRISLAFFSQCDAARPDRSGEVADA